MKDYYKSWLRYSPVPFYVVKLSVFVGASVVTAIMINFIYHLSTSHFKIPWAFFVVCFLLFSSLLFFIHFYDVCTNLTIYVTIGYNNRPLDSTSMDNNLPYPDPPYNKFHLLVCSRHHPHYPLARLLDSPQQVPRPHHRLSLFEILLGHWNRCLHLPYLQSPLHLHNRRCCCSLLLSRPCCHPSWLPNPNPWWKIRYDGRWEYRIYGPSLRRRNCCWWSIPCNRPFRPLPTPCRASRGCYPWGRRIGTIPVETHRCLVIHSRQWRRLLLHRPQQQPLRRAGYQYFKTARWWGLLLRPTVWSWRHGHGRRETSLGFRLAILILLGILVEVSERTGPTARGPGSFCECQRSYWRRWWRGRIWIHLQRAIWLEKSSFTMHDVEGKGASFLFLFLSVLFCCYEYRAREKRKERRNI